MNHAINFEAIGYMETGYIERPGTPSQGQNLSDSTGTMVIRDKYLEGTSGFKVGDRVTVVFNFHKSEGYKLRIVPFKGKVETGVFSTRSPDRPNGIGITTVEITAIGGCRIDFTGADMLDGTPILDLKPAMRPVGNLSV